jgi:ferredoxin--NADP+ reductase/benzoyl-CoA 2,3-dioxygenase component A
MTERRRRNQGSKTSGRLLLFFGARTPEELPYFGPLSSLPASFINTNLAFSRLRDAPKCYVQDLMRAKDAEVADLLQRDGTHIYVCGLRGMEDGVIESLKHICGLHGLDWSSLHQRLKDEGRIHLETY